MLSIVVLLEKLQWRKKLDRVAKNVEFLVILLVIMWL
jgi:hypothetical protein